MELTSDLNNSRYNDIIFKNKEIDEKLTKLTSQEKYYSKIYTKRVKEEKKFSEKIFHEKKKLDEKKTKIRSSMLESVKLEHDLDKKIYNRQLAFLQIEKNYREICTENKIYKPLDIKNLTGEVDLDFEKILTRKEVDKKIQNDFSKKLKIIQKINFCVKKQTDEFRKMDKQLQQDFERIKTCLYHLSKHKIKMKNYSRTVSSSLDRIRIDRLFKKMEKVKKKRELLRLSTDYHSLKLKRVQTNRTPHRRDFYSPANHLKLSVRHKRVKSDLAGLSKLKQRKKGNGKSKRNSGMRTSGRKMKKQLSIKILRSEEIRPRNLSESEEIKIKRKEKNKIIDIEIPSFEEFSKLSGSRSNHPKSRKKIGSMISITKRKNEDKLKIKREPIKVRDISKSVKNGKRVTLPGINIIPPSKRPSFFNNVVKDLSSLSSIERKKEKEDPSPDQPQEFDLKRLMQEIKQEESDVKTPLHDRSFASLEDSILDQSRISENRKIERQPNKRYSSENDLGKDKRNSILIEPERKRSSVISRENPLIVINERTNEASLSKYSLSKKSRSPINKNIKEFPSLSTSAKRDRRTRPTLPLLSVNTSRSDDEFKKPFNKRTSVRLEKEKNKKNKILNSEISPSKHFSKQSSFSSESSEKVENKDEKVDLDKKNEGKKLNTDILDINSKSYNKPKSIIKKNSSFFTPKNLTTNSQYSNSLKNRKRLSVRFSESSFRIMNSGDKNKKIPHLNSIFKEDEESSENKTGSSKSKRKKSKSNFFRNRKESQSNKSNRSNTYLSPDSSAKKNTLISRRSQAFEDFDPEEQDPYNPREYQGNPNERILTKVNFIKKINFFS